MVESFDTEQILQLSSMSKLSLSDGDILVVKFDLAQWNINQIHSFVKGIKKNVIPKGISVMPILNGVELGVIHYEN